MIFAGTAVWRRGGGRPGNSNRRRRIRRWGVGRGAPARGRRDGATAQQFAAGLTPPVPRRTLQYRLKHLVDQRQLVKDGDGRWAKYRIPTVGRGGEALTADTRRDAETSALVPV